MELSKELQEKYERHASVCKVWDNDREDIAESYFKAGVAARDAEVAELKTALAKSGVKRVELEDRCTELVSTLQMHVDFCDVRAGERVTEDLWSEMTTMSKARAALTKFKGGE